MMNPFDQFDAATPSNGISANPFDQFDKKPDAGIIDKIKGGLSVAKDFGLAVASGAGEGVASTEAGIGTFIQAPAANTLAGVTGAAALADRGITAASNYFSPGSAELSQGIQDTAREASQFATEQRATNSDANTIAKLGLNMQSDGRERVKEIQAFNREYNPELVRQQQAMSQTEGFFGALEGIKDNPMAFTNTLARSAPDMAVGAGVAKGVASGIAATGGSAVRQVAGASTAGILSESASSANQARESVYQQVAEIPTERLAASPRFNELMAATGDANKAREILANELADQAPVLAGAGTALGSVVTNKLFGGDASAAMIAGTTKTTGKDVVRNIAQEGTEEGLQGVPEDLAQHGAMLQADPSKKFDLGKTLAENMAAGVAMGGGGSFASYAKDNFGKGSDQAPPAAPQLPDTGPMSRSANIALASGAATQNNPATNGESPVAQSAQEDPFQRITELELLSEQRPLTAAESAEADQLQAVIEQGASENAGESLSQPTAQPQTKEPAAQPIADVATQSTAPQEVTQAEAIDPFMAERTEKQLKNLSAPGQYPATRKAAIAEIERRAAAAKPAKELAGEKLTKEWTAFSGESGSLGVPRADMPQIKAEHRGAMTQFMNARGVQHQSEEVAADSLKPTQAEFSPAKVKKAIGFDGGDRSILISSDNYVLDGHHQWIAKRELGKPINVIRFDAPIADLIKLSHEFPSSQTASGATKLTEAAPVQSVQQQPAKGAENAKTQTEVLTQSGAGTSNAAPDRVSRPAPATQQSVIKRDRTGLAARDDLIGAIMRVTGNKGIAADMAQTITGDKAGAGNPKLRGLFLNGGTMDLGDVSELLRVQEGFDVRDGDHLSELIRNAAAGDVATSMARTESDAVATEEAKRKDYYLKRAEELGLKKVGGKRKLEQVIADVEAKEAEIAAKEKEIAELESREERAAIQASVIADEIYQEGSELTEADLMQWLGDSIEYSQDEINEANSRTSKRESRRAEANVGFDSEGKAESGGTDGAGLSSTQAREGGTAEELTLTGQTNAQASAEFKRQQEEATKKDEATASPTVKGDQVDLFNTQDALFNSNRDVAPEAKQSAPIAQTNESVAVNAGNEQKNDFVKAPDGSIDFGSIPQLSGKLRDFEYPSAPVRMESGGDFGKNHIQPERVAEIKANGYADEVEMMSDVAQHYTHIFEQKNGRLLLVKRNGRAKYSAIELQEQSGGKYYGVTTMFLEDESPKGKPYEERGGRVLLWTVAQAVPSGKDTQFPADANTTGARAADALESNSSVAAPDTESKPAEAKAAIDDFGEKLGGAKKDRVPSFEKSLSDDDISTLPLSKIWPAGEIDDIEDKFVAAVAYAARAEVPAKPRVAYKVAQWVTKVKTVRGIAQKVINGSVTKERLAELLKGTRSLDNFAAKVDLLEAIDRDNWGRIGEVGEYPDAYRYGEDRQKIPSPSVSVYIDGKHQRFEGAKSVAEAIDRIGEALGGDVEAKKMQFEVRGSGKSFFIMKKGDKEYRKLKTFDNAENAKAAFAFIKSNYADLVSAWDGVKASDNVTKADIRNADNRPRTGKDRRNGKDVTDKQFADSFGFRGVEFGNWVSQGANAKERQGMLNQAFDAMHDLAEIVGIPPKAISLNGTLGLGFGSRGSGSASAHFEPGNLVINLTKTRGAGALAHEWFHALDNYFARMRNDGNQKTMAQVGNSQEEYRRQNFVTFKPEPLYVHKEKRSTPITRAELERYHAGAPNSSYYDPANWHKDPKHPEGVRAEVESAFADLVNTLNDSPMAKRARLIDKGPNGYWSRIIERGARSFENYVISKMMEGGYNNDYLANVREVQDFPRSKERYPYLLPEEVAPIAEAFDNLFNTIETKETDKGIAMFSRGNGEGMALRDLQAVVDRISKSLNNLPKVHVLASPSELSKKDPSQKSLRDYIRKAGAWEDAEGATHDGEIYLFASGLADETRAEHVLATHEVTHYGLRGAIGKDLDGALQEVWILNTKVRKAAAELKERYGLKSNIEATEEVLADMRPQDLIKLLGWRRVVKSVRDWLGRSGFNKLAAQFDSWLKSGLDDAQKADLMVADLVNAARDWVKNGKGRPFMDGTRLADGSLAEDAEAQEKWLTREAKGRGYKSIDDMAEKNRKAFENLAKLWREKHPLLSRAYHGSPHDHDKFDSSKIGTGEGAQAYGFGLYFAGDKSVAEHYRNALSKTINTEVRGNGATSASFFKNLIKKPMTKTNLDRFAATVFTEFRGYTGDAERDASSLIGAARNWYGATSFPLSVEDQLFDYAQELAIGDVTDRKGRLYQVELAPSEDEYLDWDKPLSEQSDLVRAAINGAEFEYPVKESTKGEDIYLHAALDSSRGFENTGYEGASDYLHSIGIRGIRYLDGSSRSAGEGNSNYVIFNDADVSITAKYNKAGKDKLTAADKAIYGMAVEGKSAAEILKFIVSASRNPFNRQVAKLLLKTGITPNITVGDAKGWKFNAGEGNKYAAAYNPKTDTVALFRPAAAERNMIHELIHAATLKALAKNGNHAGNMRLLYDFVKRTGKAKGLYYDKATGKGMYGMADVDEFVAEAFSNPKFQAALKGVEVPKLGNSPTKNAWAWFIRNIRSILGLEIDSHDALSQALDIGLGVMRENMRLLGEDGGKSRYSEIGKQLLEVADIARRPGNENSTVEIGKVQTWEVDAAKNAGFDIAGYRHTADMYSVRHIIEQHGNSEKEAARGQLPITDEDFISLPDVIMDPDSVIVGIKNNRGQEQVFSVRAMADGTLLVAEEVRVGKKTLALVSVRKVPGAKNAKELLPSVLLNVRNDAGINPIVVDSPRSVNGIHYNIIDDAKAKVDELTSPDAINTLIYNFQNKYIDLKNIKDRIVKMGGQITDLNDAYLGEETYHSKVMKRGNDFLEGEMKPLLQQLHNNQIKKEDFEQFLHARHAPERNAEMAKRNPNQAMIDAGKTQADADVKALELQLQTATAQGLATKAIESALTKARAEKTKWHGAQAFQGTEDERNSLSGMSDAAAAQVIASIPAGRRSDMDSAAAKVDAINAKTLDTQLAAGLIDKATFDAIKKAYQYYVPLHRDEAHPDQNSHSVGQGFSVKGAGIQRATGSNEKVTNILGHIALQREAQNTRAEKNSVVKRLVLMAMQNPIKDFWTIDKPPMIKTIDQRTGFVRSSVDPMYKNKPNVVMARIAGKDIAIVFNERNPEAVRLAEALKNLDGQDLDVVERSIGRVTRWIASVNTQYNPIFGLINFARDVQGAMFNLTTTELKDHKAATWKETFRLFKEISKSGFQLDKINAADQALWEDFQNNGGATGYRDLFANPEERTKALDKELKALDGGPVAKKFMAAAQWLSDYNESMENVVRLAAYKVSLQNGMSKERAASLAKNLTVNFNRKGAKAQKLGAFYAFFNASIQGSARLAQTLKGPAGRKIIAGGIALGVMQQMLGMMMMGGGDDDEWEKVPDFIKERSIVIPTGKDTYVSIPMPLGFNVIPNVGRLFAEWAMGGSDKPTGKQLAKLVGVIVSGFNPVGGTDLVDAVTPTAADPMIALLRNKDWTGKPIYREDMASLDPTPGFTRTKDSATPWAKGIAYAVNWASGGTDYQPGAVSWTPDQVDYIFGTVFGGAGREVSKLAQTLGYVTGLTSDELPMHKVPLFGRVVGSTAGVSGQSEKFYENIRTLNGFEREIKGRSRAGKDVDEFIDSEPRAELVGLANASETQVKKLRESQRFLKKDGDNAGAKEIDGMITEVMKGLNMEMRQAAR